MQKRVDKRIRELDQNSHFPGNDQILKSQRGDSVDISVKHKVHWPHEAILGGVTRQHVTYDQLSLSQWVQGLCKNILEQHSSSRRDTMVSYLSGLMEDATDFSWQGAKAAHAVLLCEIERGSLPWENGKGLIKSGGHMPKNMFQVGKHGVGQIPGSHGSAKIFRQILARSRRTMRPMVVSTDIFMHFASPKVSS